MFWLIYLVRLLIYLRGSGGTALPTCSDTYRIDGRQEFIWIYLLVNG